MAVLVTGGAGYIGSIMVQHLLAAGEQTVVLDDLSTGHRDAVAPEAAFVEGSVQDGPLVTRLLGEHGAGTVMHFAASSLVGESCEDPGKYFRNNVGGTLSLLDAMRASGADRFIFSSTAAVYGDPESVPITEDMPTRPLNPYGLSKRMIEQILEWYSRAHGIRSVALRYFNAAGAYGAYGEDHHPETHLIPNILMAADGTRERISVFGTDYDTPDGTCVRDYIHVEDLADAHLLAMEYLRDGGQTQVLNLGNSAGHSVLEVIASACRVTGKEVPVIHAGRRPGDADRLVASSDKARRLLGWKPKKGGMDVIVRDAWTWRNAHPKGYAG